MGIRIHKVMGWAMRADEFQQHCLIRSEDIHEDIADILTRTSELVIPQSFHEGKEMGYPFESNILLEGYESTGRPIIAKNAYGMIHAIYCFTPTEDTHWVVCYPSADIQKRWYRYDDDLDFAFDRWGNVDLVDSQYEMEDIFRFLPTNPYPWTNTWMDASGKRARSPQWNFDKGSPDGLFPEVPVGIRYMLTHLNIMKYEDTLRFRPFVGKWWV